MYLCIGLYRHRRTPATHVFVMMISTEARSTKPYALPVQCLSYTGLTVAKLRGILNKLLTTMTNKGMKVAGMHNIAYTYCLKCFIVLGFVSLSVLQIKANARKKYASMG